MESPPHFDDPELAAVHEVELGVEWLTRAHGALVECHHATGHGMDHLRRAEDLLREAGHQDIATRIREDVLPAGVTRRDEWTYELVESFEDGPLTDARSVCDETLAALTDGERHVPEQTLRRRWRRRTRSREP